MVQTSVSSMTEETKVFYTTPHGDYRIEKSFVLYKSVDREDKNLVYGLTEEAVHTVTSLHMMHNAPNAVKPVEQKTYSAIVGGKL